MPFNSRQFFIQSILFGLFNLCCLVSIVNGQVQQEPKQIEEPKNSTRKIRVKPSQLSSKIGTAVRWKASLNDALENSQNAQAEPSPVFWYVPTLPNTFMDRKIEIHRYMLAGPFSWPAIVDTINENTQPIRSVPKEQQQQTFELNPYDYVEPGFLLLDAQQNVIYKLDRLTTIHPVWLLRVLEKKLGVKQPREFYSPSLKKAWAAFASGDYPKSFELAKGKQPELDPGTTAFVESGLLIGMSQFRMGDQTSAKRTFEQTAANSPEHPLAWKAAAEAQGIGPFVRGFEIHRTLPEAAMQAGLDSVGSAAPKGCYKEHELWVRSTQFLLGMQNKNGGFYDSDYDFGGTDSLPNVHVAVSSLAGMALLKAYDQSLPESAGLSQDLLKDALHRALTFCLDQKNINPIDRDEILWAYAYRLRFVARCKGHPAFEGTEFDFGKRINECVVSLQSVQSRRGNWYHEYGNPFTTATALLALHEGKRLGGQVEDRVINSGVKSLAKDRFANGAYPYGNAREKRQGTRRDIASSAGRMPLCELALFCNQTSDDAALANAVSRSLELHKNLDSALKYDNHTSNMAYGGFFFWYDMRARSEAINFVLDPVQRKEFQRKHKELILALPELDGCFIDSHELGRVYGTSMALLSLANVNQEKASRVIRED